MMSLWDALRMNMMISYQELVRTFLRCTPPAKYRSGDASRNMIDVRFESEMPVSIDKAPRHDESAGWSATAISYRRGEEDPLIITGRTTLYASSGVLLVEAAGRRWVIPLSGHSGSRR
nr:Uncharacterised protein [Klebsiella pneumoniae]